MNPLWILQIINNNHWVTSLPSAASQALFSCEWWDLFISLSFRIFSKALRMNISLVFKLDCILIINMFNNLRKPYKYYEGTWLFMTCWNTGTLSDGEIWGTTVYSTIIFTHVLHVKMRIWRKPNYEMIKRITDVFY